jgi:hypothetical protein
LFELVFVAHKWPIEPTTIRFVTPRDIITVRRVRVAAGYMNELFHRAEVHMMKLRTAAPKAIPLFIFGPDGAIPSIN